MVSELNLVALHQVGFKLLDCVCSIRAWLNWIGLGWIDLDCVGLDLTFRLGWIGLTLGCNWMSLIIKLDRIGQHGRMFDWIWSKWASMNWIAWSWVKLDYIGLSVGLSWFGLVCMWLSLIELHQAGWIWTTWVFLCIWLTWAWLDCIRLNWIEFDWIGLNWASLDSWSSWIGLNLLAFAWVWSSCANLGWARQQGLCWTRLDCRLCRLGLTGLCLVEFVGLDWTTLDNMSGWVGLDWTACDWVWSSNTALGGIGQHGCVCLHMVDMGWLDWIGLNWIELD